MKSPEEVLKVQRRLRAWKGTRVFSGVLVIVTAIVMIVGAVLALQNDEDAWLAMKLPLVIAFLLLVLFEHSTRKVLRAEEMLRR